MNKDSMQLSTLDSTWLLFCAFIVMMMQAGFCMLEAGLVRSKNTINVAYKNIMDFAVACSVFWLFGYGFMYGSSLGGWLGTSQFMPDHTSTPSAFFLYQIMFCGAATTIVSGAIAERTRFSAYLFLSILIAGLLYPVAGHWVWNGFLTAEQSGWLAKLGFIDYAGGTVVHGVGGWLGLAAAMVIGPRLGRFDNDTRFRLQGSDYPRATVGVIILWFGWFGFNGGNAMGDVDLVALIAVNTALSAASGAATLVTFAYLQTRKPDMDAILNGTLAGLVGITAGCHLFSTLDAMLVGALSALACRGATILLVRHKIDDVIAAFPVHAIAGAAGTLLIAFLGDRTQFPLGLSPIQQFGIQLLGVVSIAVWAFGLGFICLHLLNRIHPLRVSTEDEKKGLNIAEHGASTELVELLGNMSEQGRNGEFANPVEVEPHTEIGEIAQEYNKVLERVRIEIQTREEAYKQLKEASHFQYIFENTHEGILQLNLQGEILKANPAAAQILGYATTDMLIEHGGAFLKQVEFTDPQMQQTFFEDLQQRGLVENLEMEFTRQIDGKQGYLELTSRRIKSTEDRDASYLVSVIDTAARKMNQQLFSEKEAAQAASQAKSEFLANMSHEIRTPLNGVTGMLELLNRTTLDTQQSRYTYIAQTSAKTLLSVINDILDISKIEAGKLELDVAEFSLHEALADIVDMFAPQASAKEIELIGAVSADVPDRVIGDPERLRQVLVNLLANAIKFTDTGSVSMKTEAVNNNGRQVHLRFRIKDSGCGIAEGQLEKLFKPFSQADTSTTRKYGGTGLGLSISRQLLQLMKGRIDARSVPERGSEFVVSLVLPLGQSQSVNSSELPAAVQGLRVLAVDDHAFNLEILTELLTPYKIAIDCVSNAADALSAIEQAHQAGSPYALGLLDFHMPETDGRELASIIRQNSSNDALKLIMLTSIDQTPTPEQQAQMGLAAHITKPIRASRLFDAIVEAMDMTHSSDREITNSNAQTDKKNHEHLSNSDADQRIQNEKTQPPKSIDSALARIETELPPRTETHDTQIQSASASSTAPRVLIVEDNSINQMVAEEMLSAQGYHVELANNGAEAITLFERGDIDLILMDCQMPVVDGFEATRKIREIEKSRRTTPEHRMPIVALTANAIKGDREKCIDAGMDEYVTKPIVPETLFGIMDKFIPAPETSEDNIQLKQTGT